MFSALILIVIVGGVGAVIIGRMNANNGQKREELQLADAVAEARRWNERLGSQVLTLTGTDEASTQAIADAAERHNAAASQISTATTVRQAELARESALEGLHYITAAREIMGLPTGPPVPPLEGQQAAGKITETRTMDYDGREFTASPHPSPQTPNYYPGGTVAGRPVPAGWYSEPWWSSALRTGMWAAGTAMLFSGLANIATASAFANPMPEIPDAPEVDADATEGGFFDSLFGGDGGDNGGFFDNLLGGDGGGFDF